MVYFRGYRLGKARRLGLCEDNQASVSMGQLLHRGCEGKGGLMG